MGSSAGEIKPSESRTGQTKTMKLVFAASPQCMHYGFFFAQKYFFRTRELEHLFFLSCKARIFFSRI
jgi:hypothetical protein